MHHLVLENNLEQHFLRPEEAMIESGKSLSYNKIIILF